MNGVQNKDNGDESPQTSVQELLYEAKLQFLEILFGGMNASYFPKLIEVADSHFNILDSVNMTKSALFLAAIKTASLEVLLKNIADEIKEDSSQTEEETTKTERCPKLLPDDSVMQYCYEYVSYSQEYVPDEREDDTSDAVKSKRSKSANLRKKKYYKDIVERPDFRKAQISQVSCLPVLNYVVSILKTAQNLVVLNRENDRDEDGNKDEAERRVAIYSDMEKYIKKCVELVQKFPEEYLISPVDFLPLLDDSNLGNYAQSEFTAMIDNIVIRKVVDDWEKHLDENINRHVSSYHGISSQLTGDQVKYFQFFFDALIIAVRDLRAITARGCQELWPAYIEMNRILKYCYFSDDNIMIFDIECESRTGQKPKKYNTENQDAFSIKKTDQFCCLCIADGAGSKRHSSKGAQWLVQDLCDYLIENASNLFEQNEEQIRQQVMSCIRQSLFKTAEHLNVVISELSSTLLYVLTDGLNGLLLHLGDGVILAMRGGYLNVLSFPINGNSKRSTALTTMITAEQHLRIQKVPCDSISIVWLMTDGAMYKVFQENYGLNGDNLSMPMIRQKLSDGNDDATYGYIKWRI